MVLVVKLRHEHKFRPHSSPPLRAHMSQRGAGNKAECFAPPTDTQASRSSQPVRLQTGAGLLSNHWSHPSCRLETETPGNHYVAARIQLLAEHRTTPRTPNYSQNTKLLAEHRITRRTPNCMQNTELPTEHPCLAELGRPFLNHLIN